MSAAAIGDDPLLGTIEAQRTFAVESGVEHAYACWPFDVLGMTNVAMGRRTLALSQYQAALERARGVHEHQCVVAALMGVAVVLAQDGRWKESA